MECKLIDVELERIGGKRIFAAEFVVDDLLALPNFVHPIKSSVQYVWPDMEREFLFKQIGRRKLAAMATTVSREKFASINILRISQGAGRILVIPFVEIKQRVHSRRLLLFYGKVEFEERAM